MAKQLNVDLRFNADTSGAKKAIADLQASLNNLMQFNQSPAFKITDEIAAANVEVSKLQVALQSALNPKTGTLDLARLQQSLQQAGSSISQVEAAFNNMGAAGQVAFQQFAATIAQAQVPTMRLNGLMGEMWTTLKNVARFQISSSIIHGLVGGLQSAFSYAQNLNESLNNIRIVTGDSSEKMAQFARDANTAAKRLSSTTLDYTNASLIYYQQGLNDQQVRERTDVTIKLANVSRQSAQEVSDQMTAIWNNFDQGSHSVEYFADVITALGATTASSSEEIATGLEKFAPIAGTIGLSYEKATSALATIVANTRQSADTVGTGLRTIFSRFESLSLGKTLEDGVDLSKYTKALKTVGVDVLDANGKLKTMDTILDDIAKAWERLDNTQKTALATTVGGVRQYTNLMALFDNWDDMQRNMATATGAEGTLQNQADIYAESWEAARNRVQTALQGLFDTLINDDAFIGMLNGIESVISGIDNFIQNMGGAKTVVLGLSAAVLSFANAGVADSLKNMVYNIKSLTGIGQKEVEQTKQNLINRALSQQMNGTPLQQAQFQASQNQVALQQTLNTYGKEYNNIQRELANLMIQGQSQYDNAVIKAQEEVDLAERRLRITQQTITARGRDQASNALLEEEIERTNELAEARTRLQNATDNASTNMTQTQKNLQNLKTMSMSGTDIFAGFTSGVTSAIFAMTALSNAMKTIGDDSATMGQKISAVTMSLAISLPMILNSAKQMKTAFQGLGANTLNTFAGLERGRQLGDISTILNSGKAQITNWNSLLGEGNTFADTQKQMMISQVARKANISQKQAEIVVNAQLAKSNGDLTAAEIESAMASAGVNVQSKETIMTKAQEAIAHKLVAAGMAESTAAAMASLAVYAAIAVAIAAVVAAIYLMVQAYNADANAAKRAAEAQKALQQKSQEAQQNLTNIKEAFQGYDDAVKALNECTKGTQEWNDALKAVNDEVLEIMENNPELAKQMQTHRDANGMLVIDNKNELLQNAQDQANNARYAALLGAVQASEAQLKSDTTNFRRQHTWSEVDENGNVNQTAVKHNAEVVKALSDLGSYAGKTVTEIAKEFAGKLPDSELQSFAEGIYNLANATNDCANQLENVANAIAESELGDKFNGAETEIASEYYETARKSIYEEIMQGGTKGFAAEGSTIAGSKYGYGIAQWSGSSNENLIEILDRFNAAVGGGYSLSSNAVRGNDSNRSFAFLKSGQEEIFSLEQIATTIAAFEAIEKGLEIGADEASKALDNLSQNVDKDTASIIENFIANGNLESATKERFEQIKEDVRDAKHADEETGIEYTGAEAYLRNLLGDSLINAAPELVSRFETALKLDFDDIPKRLSPTVASAFNTMFMEGTNSLGQNMTYDQLENITSLYQNTFNKLGKAGIESLDNIFSQIKDPKDAAELASILSSINWSTAGPNALSDAIEATGNTALSSIVGIDAFSEAIRRASAAGLAAAQSTYKTINQLIKDVKPGQQYTEEEWKQFEDKGITGLEKFFQIMPDGSRILIGNAQEFYDLVNGQLRNGFENNIEAQQIQLKELSEFNPAGDLKNLTSWNREIAQSNIDNGFGDSIINFDQGQLSGLSTMIDAIRLSGNTEFANQYGDYVDNNQVTNSMFMAISDAFRQAVGESVNWEDFTNGLGEAARKELEQSQEILDNFDLYSDITANGLDVSEILEAAAIQREYDETLQNTIKSEKDLIRESIEYQTGLAKAKKGISDLSKSLSTYGTALKKFKLKELTKDAPDVQKGLDAVASALQLILGGEKSDYDEKFITDNFEDIQKAANGDAKAIKRLETAYAKASVAAKDFQDAGGATGEQIKNELNEAIDLFANTELPDLEVGAEINTTNFYKTLSDMVAQGKISAGDMTDALSSFGMDVETEEITIPSSQLKTHTENGTVTYQPEPLAEPIELPLNGSVTQNDNGTVTFTVIKGAKYKGTGNNTGGGGGGGGGGGKQKKKDAPKPDRGARYHEVTRKQNANKRRQDAAQNTADRTIGKIHEKQLERQIKLEEKALELSRRRLHEAQQYIKEDKKALDQALKDAKVSKVKLDADGNIKNYEEIIKELYEKEKKLVEKYNKGGMSDEEFEEQKKKIDEAKEAMDNYEESIDAAQEAAEAMVESINHMIDKRLEKIKYDIEFQIEINDNDLKIMQHLFDKLDEENPHTIAQRIANLTGQTDIYRDNARGLIQERDRTMQQIADDVAMYSADNMAKLKANKPNEYKKRKEELDALLQTLGLTEKEWNKLSDAEKANYLAGTVYRDQLQEISDGLLEIDANLDEVAEQITDALLDALDQLYDKFTKTSDAIATLNDVLVSYSDIMDLTRNAIGSKTADAMIANLRTQRIGNLTTKTQRDYEFYNRLKQERALMQLELQRTDLSEKERAAKEKMYDSLLEKEREAQATYLSDATETLQLIQEKAEAAQEEIMQNFRTAMLGGDINDIDWFNTIYDRQKELENGTVEDYEKLYRLSEMEHQSNKLLDNLTNPKYRKEVLDFQKKLNEQKKANVEMSQAQLTVEQKYLDLIQARIALEEAQNAKQTVRLQRDNEGNWGYVFTNDADTISEAEANAQKALYEYQKALDDSNNEIIDKLKDFNSQLADEMDQLRDKYNRGVIDKGVFEEETQRLRDLASEQLDFYAKQYTGFATLLGLTKEEMLALYGVTEGELPDNFGETLLARLSGYDSIEAMREAILEGLDDTAEGLIGVEDTRRTEQELLAQKIGMSLDTLVQGISTLSGQNQKETEQISLDLEKLGQDFTDTFNAGLGQAESYWNQLPNILADQDDILETVGEIAEYIRDMAYAGDHTGDRTEGEQGTIVDRLLAQEQELQIMTNGEYIPKSLQNIQQILEEGNQENGMSNNLDTIQNEYEELINDLINYINLQAQTASYGFGNLMSGTYTSNTGDTIQQEVHIDANFPNVVNSSEIEQAFDNLVNKAAQFANRKRQG